jgi:hypothetical protein
MIMARMPSDPWWGRVTGRIKFSALRKDEGKTLDKDKDGDESQGADRR